MPAIEHRKKPKHVLCEKYATPPTLALLVLFSEGAACIYIINTLLHGTVDNMGRHCTALFFPHLHTRAISTHKTM